jgi:cobalt-zinc-cadmium efflux system protein
MHVHAHEGHAHPHGHDHGGHDHHHVPDSRGALLAVLALNGGFLVLEAVVGWWTGSLALLSDAAHMAGDVGALVLALVAAQLARRKASATMTFGLQRAEVLGAFVNGVALVAIVVGILVEAFERLAAGPGEVPGLPVLGVGVAGLVVNVGSAIVLLRSGRDDLNVQGALWHMVADALGSVGAILAALLLLLGHPAADPIVSVVIAGFAAWGSWKVVSASGRVLLQLPPGGFDVHGLLHLLETVPGVASVHDLHVWTLDGRHAVVTAHLVAARGHDAGRVLAAARDTATARGPVHLTLQVDPHDLDHCPEADCGAGHAQSDRNGGAPKRAPGETDPPEPPARSGGSGQPPSR